jgi:hypothetical protein
LVAKSLLEAALVDVDESDVEVDELLPSSSLTSCCTSDSIFFSRDSIVDEEDESALEDEALLELLV